MQRLQESMYARSKRREYSKEIKRQAIKSKKINPKKVFNERVEAIEMDELHRFVEKKQNLRDNTSK